MSFLILAYLAGVLTIVSPCILPVVPFVLARADQPFRRTALPLLAGMAVTFALVASLAAFAGGWAIEANRVGRGIALALTGLFGLALLLPSLATQLSTPLVRLGERLSRSANERAGMGGSALLGVATGLLWAPCAGPVLGLILAGAALSGPSVQTTLLLLAYASGAATSLAAAVLFGGRLLQGMKRALGLGDGLRRILGASVLASVLAIAFGLDTGLLTRVAAPSTVAVEQRLVDLLQTSRLNAANAMPVAASPVKQEAQAVPLFGATQWLNSPPLTTDSVKGKVVLVNFWTYSCINCLRSLPHVRAWAERYKDRGLVVVGVHTPEFAFEKDPANVGKAIVDLGIRHPVAIDNDFAIWRAFRNQAWPALYFIGADGRLHHHTYGEGDYTDSEKVIQKLLAEANGGPVSDAIAAVEGMGAEAAPDQDNLRSGETYIGYAKAGNFVSPGGIKKDQPHLYGPAPALPVNYWDLAGTWTVGNEFATLAEPGGRIAHRFHARDLHVVLAPSSPDHPVRFRITIDGKPPGADHGADVNAEGWGILRAERLYQLVRQQGPVTDRTFAIEFFDAGVRAYAFTFG